MTPTEFLERYRDFHRARGFHPRTLRCNTFETASFFRFLGRSSVVEISEEHLLHYLNTLKNGYVERTARDKFRKLLAVLRWAARQGFLFSDPTRELGLRRVPEPLIAALTLGEVEAMLALPNPTTPGGLRDLALLEILYGTGLRLCEMHPLNLEDISFDPAQIRVSRSKGGSFRVVPFGPHLASILQRYLDEARPLLERRLKTRALLLSNKGQRLGRDMTLRTLRELAQAAGISKKVTTHSFRRAFATHLLQAGASLPQVKGLLGHAVTRSTERYTGLLAIDLAKEIRRCHPRGRKKS